MDTGYLYPFSYKNSVNKEAQTKEDCIRFNSKGPLCGMSGGRRDRVGASEVDTKYGHPFKAFIFCHHHFINVIIYICNILYRQDYAIAWMCWLCHLRLIKSRISNSWDVYLFKSWLSERYRWYSHIGLWTSELQLDWHWYWARYWDDSLQNLCNTRANKNDRSKYFHLGGFSFSLLWALIVVD